MQEQRLVAIFFSDITGYSKMMGADREKTLELLDTASELHNLCIEKHHGVLHKEMGDGFMASFPSASDACSCAVELIQLSHSIKDLKLHIGIHLGEVTFKEDDIFGDGVNIAARIQALAKPDQILVSESVYLNLKNQPELRIEFFDELSLKNISENYRLYEVLTGSSGEKPLLRRRTRKRMVTAFFSLLVLLAVVVTTRYITTIDLRGEGQIKIAVLPFDDLSENESYFSQGLCYEIRNKLSSVKGFQVASSQSSMNAKSSSLSLSEINKLLKVTHVLEGSIQVFGDMIHFNLFLTNVNNDESVPIELSDYPLENINEAQVSIAMQVVNWMDQSLSEGERQSVERLLTDDPEAYKYYLLGLHALNSGPIKASLQNAEHMFRRAIELDSAFAEAWVALSETCLKWGQYGYMDNRESAIKAKVFAAKALSLQPHSGNAHIAMAMIHYMEKDPVQALAELDLAIQDDPMNEEAYFQKFRIYIFWNDFEKADEMIEKVYSLNPISIIYKVDRMLVKPGGLDKIIEDLETVVKSDPANYYAKWQLGVRYSLAGNYESAEQILRSRSVDSLENNWYLGYVFARLGKEKEARRILNYQKGKADTVYVPPSMIAMIHWGLDEKQEAYEWMRKAHEVHDNFPIMLPAFDVMESEPWFREFFYLGTVSEPRNPYNRTETL